MNEVDPQQSPEPLTEELNLLISSFHCAHEALQRLIPAFSKPQEGLRGNMPDEVTAGLWEVLPPGSACLDDLGGAPRNCAIIAPGSPSFTAHHVAAGISAKDAARIVACVNACAGIPTESIQQFMDLVLTVAFWEGGRIKPPESVVKLGSQTALRMATDLIRTSDDAPIIERQPISG